MVTHSGPTAGFGHSEGYRLRNERDNREKRKHDRGCFIATAAYGTPFANEIDTLRQWKDEDLSKSYLGKLFVDLYYRVSPPIARVVAASNSLRKAVRAGLSPVVKILKGRYETD